MNNVRKNFKHHGSIPSTIDLEQFRADVTTFLTDATELVFEADFQTLNMVDLVTQPEVRTLINEAEVRVQENNYAEALALLSQAFNDLLNDHAHRKRIVSMEGPTRSVPSEDSMTQH